ncbi:hypothetical protein AB4Y32_13455 [Paraburkholderia phymatum]|uniref:Uncharacterized protein n=1 Tax=Paraburkholderia phymatum TaxID=148447 RepID=A0ACC6TZD5_9BURK
MNEKPIADECPRWAFLLAGVGSEKPAVSIAFDLDEPFNCMLFYGLSSGCRRIALRVDWAR